MAGARVGYVLAHPDTIKQLNEFQAWANAGPSAVSMQGALAAIKDKEFVAYCKQENIKAKDILYQGFDALGIKHIKSFTSFVYFDTATYKKDIPALLLANQIIVKEQMQACKYIYIYIYICVYTCIEIYI